MRVVSGVARGRPLRAALPQTVRPTSDRVKESIFDIVGSLGGVDDLDVVDLFCGSGALGIEALSRGASSVLFVDADTAALAAAKENLAGVGLDESRASFVRATLPGWRPPRADLVLADPPYGSTNADVALASIDADLVVIESRDEIEVPEPWRHLRQRRYGTTLVTVLTSQSSDTMTS